MRFLADALSALNLLCGVGAIVAAAHGRLDLAMGLLLAGAGFDAFDGIAARRFGGSRIGALADDIADGVTNGIAPGAALWFVVGGTEGVALGTLFCAFTLARLVFFTLNKGEDNAGFRGLPSTAGAAIVLAGLVLFPESPALIGLLTGSACVLMTAFDARYRHLGRVVADSARARGAVLAFLGALVLSAAIVGPWLAAAILLAATLAYGLGPIGQNFRAALVRRAARPA
ncbi:MAG TPA: CDP-alcohol phosphatidyltransferase family protein [Myxococcota bacterium]|nr:CDP-alcohol phosphatidyltransferase family protein [Myxococcota bacterium]